jgi:LacI family transcriptional regulator
MKRATIKDIGILAGVNPSTVSRALRNHPDVSAAVKTKITEIAKQLKYVPNDTAVNLRTRNSKLIGLIVPSITMFFTPSVIDGISDVLQKNGFKLMVLCSHESLEQETENIKICCNAGADGILISCSNQTKNISHLEYAHDLEIPLVMFDKTVSQSTFDEVIIDNKDAAEQCANYLLQRKCKNIIAVYGNKNMSISSEREKAFTNAIKKSKATVVKNLNASDSIEAQNKTLAALLSNANIDGVFAMSDEVLTGVHGALQRITTSNCSLIAISDGKLPPFYFPQIPYLKHDGFALGQKAINLLLSYIDNTKETNNVKKHLLETEMITY